MTPATVLIVEDNPETRKMFRQALQSEGFTVLEAGDEGAALEVLRAEAVDLVLQDLGLSGMDGFQLAKQLRTLPGLADLPILAVSGFLSKMNQKRAEDALRKSEERYRHLVEHATDVIYKTDADGRWTFFNQVASRMLKYSEEELLGHYYLNLVRPDYREAVGTFYRRQFYEKIPSTYYEFPAVAKDGTVLWIGQSTQLVVEHEQAVGFQSVGRDITERRQAEEALRRLQEEQQLILDSAPALIFYKDTSNRILRVNEAAAKSIGLPKEQIEGTLAAELYPNEADQFYEDERIVIQTGLPRLGILESYHSPSGERRWVQTDKVPLKSESGLVTGIIVVAADITERKLAEEALRESQAHLEQAQAQTGLGSWVLEPASKRTTWSKEMFRLLGRDPALGAPMWDEVDAIHPEDRPLFLSAYASLLKTDEVLQFECRTNPAHGPVKHLLATGQSVRDAEGRPIKVSGTILDVTQRRQLEEQLRQSQKMEVVGRLAAGVAHDFNNLLTVIEGYSDLLIGWLGDKPEVVGPLQQIALAGRRAADLTRQLLLFSRKQSPQPKEVDLNELSSNLTKMLGRMLGEDINLQFSYETDLQPVQADPSMLEQVIMNLAVNARDAMPEGGRLRIITSMLKLDASESSRNPHGALGSFVCLEVADTGAGIAPENLEHIFEPFFTTKEVGKGTGLGLASAYGIVMQHNGWIEVSSELGSGTTFRIFLPAAEPTGTISSQPSREGQVRGGDETILLVEDDPAVSRLVTGFLQQFGYTVLTAASGVLARDIWQEHAAHIDVLVTDMVMPGGVSGAQLANVLKVQKPSLRVVYTSGYSPDVLSGRLELIDGFNYVQKPFAPTTLLEVLRRRLDAS